MINVYTKELKNKTNISNYMDDELIHYKINEKTATILKFKKNKLTYIKSSDVISFINDFFCNISSSLKMDINVDIVFEHDCYNIKLNCDNNSLLIGKDGNTLKSMQLLIHQIINNISGFNLKINVDCSDYKIKKINRLESEIKNICNEVLNSKIEARLDPMNSYERRIIHNIASSYKELTTISQGIEPNRYVIIKFKED